jgi:hypothetical protein
MIVAASNAPLRVALCVCLACAFASTTTVAQPRRQPLTTRHRTSAPSSTSACATAVPSVDQGVSLGVNTTTQRADEPTTFSYRSVAVFLLVTGVAPPPRDAADRSTAVRLELSGPTSRRVGQPLDLRVTVHNATTQPVTLLRSNDGSFEHLREPFVDLYAQSLEDRKVYRYTAVGPRCGSTNAARPEDLVRMARGGRSRGPFAQWTGHLTHGTIERAGRFRVWVVYRQCDWRLAQGMIGSSLARPADLFEGELSSNAIEIEVR